MRTVANLLVAALLLHLQGGRGYGLNFSTKRYNIACWDGPSHRAYAVTYGIIGPRILWCASCDYAGLALVWVRLHCRDTDGKPEVDHWGMPTTTADGRTVANVVCACDPCYSDKGSIGPKNQDKLPECDKADPNLATEANDLGPRRFEDQPNWLAARGRLGPRTSRSFSRACELPWMLGSVIVLWLGAWL